MYIREGNSAVKLKKQQREELSKVTGRKPETIRRYLSGSRRAPESVARRISQQSGIDLREFLRPVHRQPRA